MEDKLATYGGQAVIEGVMMRGRINCAIALRGPDGKYCYQGGSINGHLSYKTGKDPFLARIDLTLGFSWFGYAAP